MPEGDTLHKLAAAIGRGLIDATLVGGRILQHPELDLRGRVVEGVRAVGKHLWIDFADGNGLRTHLGMRGSWHRYAHGETWLERRRRVSVELHSPTDVWVLFAAAEVEWVRGAARADATLGGRLGPDLVQELRSAQELQRRAQTLCGHDTLLIDVLLDQRVACGLGNVYKCELMFLERLAVRTRLNQIEVDQLGRLYALGAQLLRRNLGSGSRTTRFERDGRGSLWVYGRTGAPCLRCGATIERSVLGRHRRTTMWCPGCQGEMP